MATDNYRDAGFIPHALTAANATDQQYRWCNGTDSTTGQTIHWYRQRKGTDGAVLQTAQWYREHTGTDSARVQTAQWYRQRNSTDSSMMQTAQWNRQSTEVGSRRAHGLCLCHICRVSKADLEHDIQGVWILYFHCYNGATVLQLGLVHLQGTCSLLDT